MKSGNEPISSIMTADVIVIDQSHDLNEALTLMEEKAINHLPVIKGGKMVGIISMTDIKRIQYLSEFVGNKVSSNTTFQIFDVEEVMTKNVKTVSSDTSIKEVAKIFSLADYHSLPVMSGERVVGIVSVKDVMAYYAGE